MCNDISSAFYSHFPTYLLDTNPTFNFDKICQQTRNRMEYHLPPQNSIYNNPTDNSILNSEIWSAFSLRLAMRQGCSLSFFLYLKILFILFLEWGEEREKEKERNTNVWLPLTCPLLGTWPPTQSCALTGNQTSDPLVHRLALNPGSHTSQGLDVHFHHLSSIILRFQSMQYEKEIKGIQWGRSKTVLFIDDIYLCQKFGGFSKKKEKS